MYVFVEADFSPKKSMGGDTGGWKNWKKTHQIIKDMVAVEVG